MDMSENRTDGMRLNVARTGAVWATGSCRILAGFYCGFREE